MKKSWVFYALLTLGVTAVACLASVLAVRSMVAPQIVYVDMAQVFDGFTMTKVLKQGLERRQSVMTRELDSMQVIYRKLSEAKTPKATLDNLALRIQQIQERYTEEDQTQTQRFNEQIWTQLSQYMKEYAAQRGYALVLGRKPVEDDVIMAGAPALDQTQDAIAFINSRYEPVK